MTAGLIVSTNAQEFETEICRLADEPIPVTACHSAEEALSRYTNQSFIFGKPDMVAAILPKMPSVKWVQSTWAGVEPLVALDRRNYILTVVKNVFGPQMSEYVFAYLLAHELKLAERQRQQQAHHWFSTSSGSLAGKKMGIMGTGSIGQHIAITARVFGLKTVGLSRSGSAVAGFEQVMPVGQLHDFLQQIDYLVTALPGTPGTNHILDAAALARLPSHAFLINIGRGNAIDIRALVDALNEGRIAGAALDVFEEEPISAGSPLWDTKNLSITAHIAAIGHPSLIVPIFLENYRRYTRGQALEYVFDFDTGY